MKDGIYHVKFASGQQSFGEGLAVIKSGTVNGGDASYLYKGTLSGPDASLVATLHVQRWNQAGTSVFGNLQSFDLNLSGAVHSGANTFAVTGGVPGQGALKISITGRYLADAV